ncbi:hypothetical protein BDF21DRAFT_377119 [Thamnidium elegans]|uniref:Arrestin C-terminal-like domain-containing protein n=1 Tax=Thamnidium elegans TaxID=101142 RepID=A0A8H7VWP5_9FUNG|nr:hypothetical protein INT48_006635 [Thamnidium elegans]KAI8092058.1 hypothetical protein BDF21DRAFT_377119 [Thamnidium elegans]
MLNVHPMHFTQSPEFRIQLENDHLILHGNSEESAGTILRGSVLFNCQDKTRVKSIKLKFSGMTSVSWCEGRKTNQKVFKAKRTIIEKELIFLDIKKKHHLCQGQYKWDFEIPLPGNLPETIHHELGKVQYQLKAYCDRPKFSKDYMDECSIRLSRHLLASSVQYTQEVEISNVWENKVAYNISIPSKIYSPNKIIPVSFDLLPLAPNLKIESVVCSLKEYVTCATSTHQKTTSRVLNFLRDDHFTLDPVTGRFTKTQVLIVPGQRDNRLHFDMRGELIEIQHTLKFTVSLENADGHISELKAAIPMVIAPSLPEDEDDILPPYQENRRSIYYDPETLAHMIAMGEVMPCSRSSPPSLSSITSGSSIGCEDDVIPTRWMGMDISTVPSYATALLASNIPCASSCSLPTYESITVY